MRKPKSFSKSSLLEGLHHRNGEGRGKNSRILRRGRGSDQHKAGGEESGKVRIILKRGTCRRGGVRLQREAKGGRGRRGGREGEERRERREEEGANSTQEAIRGSQYPVYDGFPCQWRGVVDNKPMVGGLEAFGSHVLETFWKFMQEEVSLFFSG
jgi:hypothetical protein